MTKRMSSKERIRQKADEAAAGEIQKIEKKKKTTSKKTTSKKAATAIKRKKVVWKVFDENFREVASFPYLEKAEAQAKADDLTRKKNKEYLVEGINVPMEDN